jgi:hypothetical protein
MGPELDQLIHNMPRDLTPKDAMWKAIAADHMPSNKPSHVACAPPIGNNPPPPAVAAAIGAQSRLIFSTII